MTKAELFWYRLGRRDAKHNTSILPPAKPELRDAYLKGLRDVKP